MTATTHEASAAQDARIGAAVKAASDLTHIDGVDPYRVTVWESRRFRFGWFRFGPWGWRRAVSYLGDHAAAGDWQSVGPRRLWCRSREDALADGIETALYIHGTPCPERPDDGPTLPLVVFVAGKAVIDERPGGAR